MHARNPVKTESGASLSWTAITAIRANPALRTNSSFLADHSTAFARAYGVLSKRLRQHWSHKSHELNFEAHASICFSVTRPGSSVSVARIRASWMPELQSPAASAWSLPASLAIARSFGIGTPSMPVPLMPNRFIPSTFFGSAIRRSSPIMSAASLTGRRPRARNPFRTCRSGSASCRGERTSAVRGCCAVRHRVGRRRRRNAIVRARARAGTAS